MRKQASVRQAETLRVLRARLESLKAFVPCRCEHAGGVPVLAICGGCGSVEEHDGDALAPVLSALVSETGFAAERHVVEIHGRCTSCIA